MGFDPADWGDVYDGSHTGPELDEDPLDWVEDEYEAAVRTCEVAASRTFRRSRVLNICGAALAKALGMISWSDVHVDYGRDGEVWGTVEEGWDAAEWARRPGIARLTTALAELLAEVAQALSATLARVTVDLLAEEAGPPSRRREPDSRPPGHLAAASPASRRAPPSCPVAPHSGPTTGAIAA